MYGEGAAEVVLAVDAMVCCPSFDAFNGRTLIELGSVLTWCVVDMDSLRYLSVGEATTKEAVM